MPRFFCITPHLALVGNSRFHSGTCELIMKTKSLFILVLVALCIATISCKKDGASTSEESSNNNNPTNCNDPSGTITANLRNDDGYITILGGTLRMNSADNFVFDGQQYHERTLVSLGKVDGLGCVTSIPENGWANQVAVIPDYGYIVKDKYYYYDYNNVYSHVKYARIYVTRYLSSNNAIIGSELKYQDNWWQEPSVTTKPVTNITRTTAECGGMVDAEGNAITERGICWGVANNPTIHNTHVYTEEHNDDYTLKMTGLEINTTYYVRAYVKSSTVGVTYGNNVSFKTLALATVITNHVTNVTQNSATCSCNITDDGGSPVTERGVCWNTTGNPNINENHTSSGSGTGGFSVEMTNLSAGTTYHIKAYATNSIGTSYGDEVTFSTSHEWHNGILPGVFSISATKQVHFSQGNLQYRASTDTWRFAGNQYDVIGTNNTNISSSYNEWIDLFGWGTSGWNNGNVYYHPYDSDYCNGSLYGPEGNYDLTGEYANSDWGVYNRISNGGNNTGMWRTLTAEEWNYVFKERFTLYGGRFAMARVNNVCGIILLPDDWDNSVYSLTNINCFGMYFNIITDWTIMENAGAVFLPAAGYRNGNNINLINDEGSYWTASANGIATAHYVYYNGAYFIPMYSDARCVGHSVRLVYDAN